MKTIILLALAVIGVYAVEEQSVARSGFSVGDSTGRALVHNTVEWLAPRPGTYQSRHVTFRTRSGVRISAVEVSEVEALQGASASITAGGIGQTFVTIRFLNPLGLGYHYRFNVWA